MEIENIFDYLKTYGNDFKVFKHLEQRDVTLQWHGEINMFTASWIEKGTILTGIFSESVIYNMLNKKELIEMK